MNYTLEAKPFSAEMQETEDMLGLLDIEEYANDNIENNNRDVLSVIEKPAEIDDSLLLEEVLEGVEEKPAPLVKTPAVEEKKEVTTKTKEETRKENEKILSVVTDETLQAQCEAEIVKIETEIKAGSFFTQKKVEEKTKHFFKTLRGGAPINMVVRIALEVIKRDGYIECGHQGNLYKALLEKPYSVGTANAQSGQIIDMFPRIGLMIREGKILNVNPKSKILEYALNLV